MIKTLLTGVAMAMALSSPVLAQEDEPFLPPTPAQRQVQDRVATAVFDVCLPLLDGADATSGWARLGVAPPAVPGADDEPLSIETDDGVRVLVSSDRCSIGAAYDEEAGVGDALNGLTTRMEAAAAAWTQQPGLEGVGVPYLSADARTLIFPTFPDASVSVTRFTISPEEVRAHYAAVETAERRTAGEAVMATPALCAVMKDEDTAPTPDFGGVQVEIGGYDRFSGALLRGQLIAYLQTVDAGCTLEVIGGDPTPTNPTRIEIGAALSAAGSGWTTAGANAWTRVDGARIAVIEPLSESNNLAYSITPPN